MSPTSLARESVATYGASSSTPTDLLLSALGLPNGISLAEILSGSGAAHGLARSTRAKVEALAELIRRAGSTSQAQERITSPRTAGSYLLPKVQGWTEERFGMLALNAKGEIIADRIISQGTTTGTMISPREFFREALRYGATTALAYHNHPSGDPSPSREDCALTTRLRAAGESLGVALADHIVVGRDSYHSFRSADGWDR